MKTHDPVAPLEHRTTHPDHLPSSAPGLKIEITKVHSRRMRTAALYRTGDLCPGGSLSGGFSVQGVSVQGVSVWGGMESVRETPSPVDRQTPVKMLPCPKLRLRAVKITNTVTIHENV